MNLNRILCFGIDCIAKGLRISNFVNVILGNVSRSKIEKNLLQAANSRFFSLKTKDASKMLPICWVPPHLNTLLLISVFSGALPNKEKHCNSEFEPKD